MPAQPLTHRITRPWWELTHLPGFYVRLFMYGWQDLQSAALPADRMGWVSPLRTSNCLWTQTPMYANSKPTKNLTAVSQLKNHWNVFLLKTITTTTLRIKYFVAEGKIFFRFCALLALESLTSGDASCLSDWPYSPLRKPVSHAGTTKWNFTQEISRSLQTQTHI